MALTYQEFRRYLGVLALLSLLVPSSPARAVLVEGLYQATVTVTGEAEEQLQAGYRSGLEEVLVRVSGDRSVLNREGIEAHLENARALLQSWQFEPPGAGDNQLQMAFAPQAVNRVLADTGAPVWGVNRPRTLAWIAVQDGGDRGLLVETGESSDQGWSALIRDHARQRGLPLVLPPAERAGDRTLLSEVWGQFMGQVARASSGIEHDLLAVVRIARRNGGWQASWLYQGRGLEQSRSVAAETPEALAQAMVDAWTTELASRFGVTGSAINTGPYVRLVLEGVTTPVAYAASKQALAQLNPVTAVGAISVSGDRLVFRVEHSGQVAQLQQNIALDERFRPLGNDNAAPTGQSEGPQDGTDNGVTTLVYRWQPSVIAPAGSGDQ